MDNGEPVYAPLVTTAEQTPFWRLRVPLSCRITVDAFDWMDLDEGIHWHLLRTKFLE